MVPAIQLRTDAWYGDRTIVLHAPDHWEVRTASMAGAPALTPSDLARGFARPIGGPALRELAGGHSDAAIVIDDITRPTPLQDVLPLVLEELSAAGVREQDVAIVLGTGTHRPMTREEVCRKAGRPIAERIRIVDHNPYEDLTFVGTTSRGVSVRVNATVAAADLTIGLGALYPHGAAGFSGGGKIIIPGVAGIETIEGNHRIAGAGYAVVDHNANREDIEEGANLAGLRFIVNLVLNADREICGLFAGDPVAAHRAAARMAEEVYATALPRDVNAVLANAYPMDGELFQAAKALGVAVQTPGAGVVVLHASCRNGFGYHALCQPGGRMHPYETEMTAGLLAGKRLVIVSADISPHDVRKKFPADTILCRSWDEAIPSIEALVAPDSPRLAVLPTAPIQIYARS